MNIVIRQPLMTREQFFDWAQAQDARYEFDGFQPVAMTGGNLRHNMISLKHTHRVARPAERDRLPAAGS